MRKKGFTFVELAIVLVIIGIIMGMLIKGRALIETARLKSEIRKIERVQTGVAGWFSKTTGGVEAMDAFPLVGSDTTTLDYKALSDLSAADMTHPYGKWTLRRGKLTANADNATYTDAGINVILHADNVTPRFACNIEFMLDDRSFTAGNGRSEVVAILTTVGDPEFKPCDDWAEAIPLARLFDYRIF